MTKTARPIPDDYLPRPIRQLDGSRFAGGSCGDVMLRNGLRWSTGGHVSTSTDANRRAMGTWSGQREKPPTDATSMGDQLRAWATYRDDARDEGLRLGAFTIRLVVPWSEVIDALEAGYAVGLQYSYAVINERRPDLSGDRNFQGLHAALIVPGVRRRGSKVSLLVYDGLYDGRRPGIPKGPQWLPVPLLRMAAERKVFEALMADGSFRPGKPAAERRQAAHERADGTVVMAIIARSTPIVKPQPEPEPEPTPEPVDPCAASLARCEELMERRDETIDRLQLALGTARTALEGATRSLAGMGLSVEATADSVADALADVLAILPGDPDDGTVTEDGVAG